VLNGTILFILVTCTLATVIGEKGAHNIALADAADDGVESGLIVSEERILIHTDDFSTVDELVNLSVTVTSDNVRNGIYAVHVADNSLPDETAKKNADKLLEKAAVAASSTDNALTGLLRYDCDVANGISCVIREQKITDLILGLHHHNTLSESLLDSSLESILGRTNVTTFIYKPFQPLSTIRRTIMVIPEWAENEIGFLLWLRRAVTIIKNTGSKLVVYASKQTIACLRESYTKTLLNTEYKVFQKWDDFLLLSSEVKNNDNLIIVMSRKHHHSYHPKMARIPSYLNKYFLKNSFILIYPVQSDIPDDTCEDIPVQPVKKVTFSFESVRKMVEKVYKRK